MESVKIWPEWKIEDLIGEGSYGKVYKVQRENQGRVEYAALKVIDIPKDESEINALLANGMDQESIVTYYQMAANDLFSEIKIMESLRSAPNVVTLQDARLEKKEDNIGWTIYIRMELLTSMEDYLRGRKLTKDEVMKLGIDICSAIASCEKAHIIHRDIKPQNIFVNEFGDFKLGDFGIAKQLEKTGSVRSMKGTSMYMAPEVTKGQRYDHTVDIYSLGIMLYRFMNHGRAPFYPAYPKTITPIDVDTATQKKNDGEKMPAPEEADKELARIILKACSFNPAERYQSAGSMRNDLEKSQLNRTEEKNENESPLYYDAEDETEIEKTEVLRPVSDEETTEDPQTAEKPIQTEKTAGTDHKEKKPAGRFRLLFLIPVIVLAVLITAVMLNRKSRPEETPPASASDTAGEDQSVTETENSSEQTSEIKDTDAAEDSGEEQSSTGESAEREPSMIMFGTYEQDGDTSNGKEPIEWRVLAREEDRILLISEYGLSYQYHDNPDQNGDGVIRWETSTGRDWLNNTFLNEAFSEEEQARILETAVTVDRNMDYEFDPGNDTTDKLFLLSISEAKTYFSSDEDRIMKATAYAINEGVSAAEDGTAHWWLRSPGHYVREAAYVTYEGIVNSFGDNVYFTFPAMRPAMWIKAE